MEEERRLSDDISDSAEASLRTADRIRDGMDRISGAEEEDPYGSMLKARRAAESGTGRAVEPGAAESLGEAEAAETAGAAAGTAEASAAAETVTTAGTEAAGGAAAAVSVPEIGTAALIVGAVCLVFFLVVTVTAYITSNTDIEKQYEDAVQSSTEAVER